MLGNGPLGAAALGGGSSGASTADSLRKATSVASLSIASIIIPEAKTLEGVLVSSNTAIWSEIAYSLGQDWSAAQSLSPYQWEEMVAGAFKKSGYDEVILTPRSGDLGRDVIATKHGVGCVKIIGSVKAYKPEHLVGHDDVRALLGVLSGETNASKAMLTTTSGFAPKIQEDPFIAPFLPTRLELLNGQQLQEWFRKLADTK
jgi:restriction system protein